MDDGSTSQEMSLEMLRIAAGSGTTDIVATPHSSPEYEYKPALIDERIRELNELTNNTPRIHRGCDLHLSFDNVVEVLETPAKYSINGKRYLLVECSDFHITERMDRVLDQMIGADLVPIVTHPERNPILRKEKKRLEQWVGLGCLVQVTALSVLGGFGKSALAASMDLLDRGMVHVIASDAHDPVHRNPRLDIAYDAITAKYGAYVADLLCVGNPGRIIRGEWVSPEPLPVEPKRKWWQVFGGRE